MPFQSSVGTYVGVGAEAQPASTSPIIAAAGGPDAFRAGEDGVTIGTFVFRDATDSTIVTNVAPNASAVPVGFIQNVGQATLGYLATDSMLITEGREVSPKVGGDFWAKSTTVATVGQKVFASVTTGKLATGTAGATVTGFSETGFWVAHGAPIGDLIIISNWSKA